MCRQREHQFWLPAWLTQRRGYADDANDRANLIAYGYITHEREHFVSIAIAHAKLSSPCAASHQLVHDLRCCFPSYITGRNAQNIATHHLTAGPAVHSCRRIVPIHDAAVHGSPDYRLTWNVKRLRRRAD